MMEQEMKIAFASDHSGYHLRNDVIAILNDLGVNLLDFGSNSPERVEFIDFNRKLCNAVRNREADRGIMLCGTGIGVAIAANKYPGIRACVCHDVHSAHQGVEHDNMNVLCLGAKIIGAWHAKDIIESFMRAEFSNDDFFRKRTAKIDTIELEAARELLKKLT